ncbi:YidC/Oxa1 family membrane protein insertase [Chloroflexota bacterium]
MDLNLWELIVQQPVINILIMLSHYLASSFGLAIIALTIVVNVLMLGLTRKQLKATQAMQSLQPKIAELKKKHASDKQKLAQEQMKLYKESGMNPAGCLLPMLIQMPIWIALYQSIIMSLAVAPEGLLNLGRYLYSWPAVYSILPLGKDFLWLNLAQPDMLLAILVGGTMWLQQKMTMLPTADPKQRSQSQMMLWMMPLMFAFFALSFPSGLALFWVTSSVIRVVIQYFATGWGGLVPSKAGKQVIRDTRYKRRIAEVESRPLADADIGADIVEPNSTQEEGLGYGKSGDKWQDRGGGYPTRLRATRHRPRGSGGHRSKGR